MIPQHNLGDFKYVALVPHGDQYIEAVGVDLFESDPSDFAALDKYIKRSYEPVEGKVAINGNIYVSTIYIPKLGNDYCYVLTDENKIPIGSEVVRAIVTSELEHYISQINKELSKTEALSQDLSTSVWPYFIKPEFRVVQPEASERISWEQLHGFGRLVIVGSPGSGKTTCLRRLTLEFANSKGESYLEGAVPVYLQMRQFSEKEFTVSAVQEIFNTHHAPGLAQSAIELSTKGGLVLLLDGLDEVRGRKREEVISRIIDVCRSFPRLKVIISMRYGTYESELPDFTHVEIAPFNASQIKQWCYQVIQDKKPWDRFFLHLSEIPELLEIARNPLMLSIAVSLYLRYAHTPHKRTGLFEQYVKALIEDWDSVRGVNRSNEIWTAPNKKLFYLCNLSFHLNKADRLTFSTYDCKTWRDDIWDEFPEQKLLSSLAEDTGLFLECRDSEWSFIHESMVRYLAAKYLVDCTIDVKKFFRGKLKEERFRSVWVYACGIAYDPSRLLDVMLKAREVDTVSKLILLSDVLAEEVKINEDLAKQCCRYIRSGVEKLIAQLSPSEPEVDNLIDLDKEQIAGLIILEGLEALDWQDKTQFFNLFRLLRSVHKLRSATIRKLLEVEFGVSKIDAVRAITPMFHLDGELNYKIIEGNDRKFLVLYVIKASSMALSPIKENATFHGYQKLEQLDNISDAVQANWQSRVEEYLGFWVQQRDDSLYASIPTDKERAQKLYDDVKATSIKEIKRSGSKRKTTSLRRKSKKKS